MVEWTTANGAELRRLREAKGLTQRQVSVALDVAQAAVSGWERGESRPRLANAMALGELVGDEAAVLAVCGYDAGRNQDVLTRLEQLEETVARLVNLMEVAVSAAADVESKRTRRRPKS